MIRIALSIGALMGLAAAAHAGDTCTYNSQTYSKGALICVYRGNAQECTVEKPGALGHWTTHANTSSNECQVGIGDQPQGIARPAAPEPKK